jgi:hypothetical protein
MIAAGPSVPIGDAPLAREKRCGTDLLRRKLFGLPGVSIPALHGWSVG